MLAVNGGIDSDSELEDGASEEEFTGFSSAKKGKGKQTRDAFEDDEQLATVTIVEEFDPHSLRHGPSLVRDSPSDASIVEPASPAEQALHQSEGPRIASRKSSLARRPKSTKDAEGNSERKGSGVGSTKKIAYETKAARKAERHKQRTRKLEKAARAGRKANHRDSAKGRRKGKH
jgi:ribosomal RNA-processing protein 17